MERATGCRGERRNAAARIRAAVAAHPLTVAGRRRFDTELMSLLGARAFVKSGAEGVVCAALPEAGLGLAVKADDGAGRAAQVMIAALIRRFGGFDERRKARFRALRLAAADELERRRGRAIASGGPAGVTRALLTEGLMCQMSARRRAVLPLRLMALASLALISTAGLSRAADRCADIAQSVQMLHEGDQYQAATLLFAAARFGCEREARALLDRGAAIDAKDREGATALAKAAEAGKIKVVKLLLERGAEVNARAVDGSTPLFYAAKEDRGAAVALLLERGADPNLPGREGHPPARRRGL